MGFLMADILESKGLHITDIYIYFYLVNLKQILLIIIKRDLHLKTFTMYSQHSRDRPIYRFTDILAFYHYRILLCLKNNNNNKLKKIFICHIRNYTEYSGYGKYSDPLKFFTLLYCSHLLKSFKFY